MERTARDATYRDELDRLAFQKNTLLLYSNKNCHVTDLLSVQRNVSLYIILATNEKRYSRRRDAQGVSINTGLYNCSYCFSCKIST